MRYDAKILEIELVDHRPHRPHLHVAPELLEPIELTESVRTLRAGRALWRFLADVFSERARVETPVEVPPSRHLPIRSRAAAQPENQREHPRPRALHGSQTSSSRDDPIFLRPLGSDHPCRI